MKGRLQYFYCEGWAYLPTQRFQELSGVSATGAQKRERSGFITLFSVIARESYQIGIPATAGSSPMLAEPAMWKVLHHQQADRFVNACGAQRT